MFRIGVTAYPVFGYPHADWTQALVLEQRLQLLLCSLVGQVSDVDSTVADGRDGIATGLRGEIVCNTIASRNACLHAG